MSFSTRKYTDLDLSFTAHPITGDIPKLKDLDAIIGSLRNLFATGHYSRLFNPQIGSNMRRLLFEPIDELTSVSIKDDIKYTVTNYEPRVRLEQVEVTPDHENNRYDVSLSFFLVNDPEPITISFFLERVR